jgi:thioredoxin reductase
VPGEDLSKVVYRLIEPEPFAGKHVLVVGGGNAAADCAIALAQAKICASVALSYRKDKLARLRGSVRAEIDRCFKAETIRPLLPTEVVAIGESSVRLKGPSGTSELRNDSVIVQIGGTAPSELLKTIGIDLVEKRGEV